MHASLESDLGTDREGLDHIGAEVGVGLRIPSLREIGNAERVRCGSVEPELLDVEFLRQA